MIFSRSVADIFGAFGSRTIFGLIWNLLSSMRVISIGNLVPIPVAIGTGKPVRFSNKLDLPQDWVPAITSCRWSAHPNTLRTERVQYPWQFDVLSNAELLVHIDDPHVFKGLFVVNDILVDLDLRT
jgi:hypothetical protein